MEYTIDCDATPFTPGGWLIRKDDQLPDAVGGSFAWVEDNVALVLAKKYRRALSSVDELRREFEDKPVLNANVLDYLLKNPHLIPEDWKSDSVFFWGTIYRDRDGDQCVRALSWDRDKWVCGHSILVSDRIRNSPAACLSPLES